MLLAVIGLLAILGTAAVLLHLKYSHWWVCGAFKCDSIPLNRCNYCVMLERWMLMKEDNFKIQLKIFLIFLASLKLHVKQFRIIQKYYERQNDRLWGWECPKGWSANSTYLKVVWMMTTNDDKFQEVLALARSEKTEFHLRELNRI